MKTYFYVIKHFRLFEGRARRSEFWQFILTNSIVAVFLYFILFILSHSDTKVANIALLVFLAVILLPTLSVSFRRIHDTGRSGWWLLLGLVPILGQLTLLIIFLQDSQLGYNKWGEYPKFVHCF